MEEFVRPHILLRIRTLQDKGCDPNCDVDLLTTEELYVVYFNMIQNFESIIELNEWKTIAVGLCLAIEFLAHKLHVDVDTKAYTEHEKIKNLNRKSQIEECVKSYANSVKIKVTDAMDILNQKEMIEVIDMLCADNTLLQKIQNVRSLTPDDMIM